MSSIPKIPMLTSGGDESSIPESDLQRYLNIGWKIADEVKEVKDTVDNKDVNEVKEALAEEPTPEDKTAIDNLIKEAEAEKPAEELLPE